MKILNLLQSEKYKRCLDFFDSHIEFSESQNPTGVWKECEEYALKHGKIHTRPIQIKDALGIRSVSTIESTLIVAFTVLFNPSGA